jgi:DNA repair protein RadD
MAFELRGYQKESVDIGVNFFESNKVLPGILVLPTGAGKSIVVAEIAKRVKSPILCIQPSKELLIQNYNKYISLGLEAELYSASVNSKKVGEVTFATIGSLKGDAVQKLREIGLKYVIIDECHFNIDPSRGSMFSRFISAFGKDVKVLGLTATPFRLNNSMDGAKLSMLNRTRPKFFQNILYVAQIEKMVKHGWWAKLNYEMHPYNRDLLKLNSNGSNYTDESIRMANDIQKTNNKIYVRLKSLLENGAKSILVFMDTVENCKIMAKHVPGSRVVSAETKPKERDEIIEKFKSGEVKVVLNYGTLTTGFDYPEMEYVVVGRPTNSFALLYQMCGRVCRPHPNKESGNIVDFCGNIDKFGKLESVTIEDIENYGWAVVSDQKVITGFLMGGPDIFKEELVNKNKPRIKTDVGNYVVQFGKHKGVKLKDIKRQYLMWTIYDSGWEFNAKSMKEYKVHATKYLEETKLDKVK